MKERSDRQTRPDGGSDEEPFLRRWMRRKADAAGTSEAQSRDRDEAAQPVETDSRSQARGERDPEAIAGEEGRGDETGQENVGEDEEKGDEDMPPLESIDEGGSVADFFSPRVSRELRRAALRRLFAQSQLPVVDDLDDYAGDYTKFTRMGGLVTNEMKHRLEVAAQRLARRADEQLTAADPEPAAEPEPDAPTGHRNDGQESMSDTEGTDEEERSEHDRTSD